MSDLRTAAQQALEYMKSVGQADMHPEEWAIVERLEAALAQQAEPVEPFCYLRQSTSDRNPPHGWAVHFSRREGDVAVYLALQQQAEPYRLPDDLYDSTDWRAGTYAERVAWLHAMYESAKKERDALLYPPEPLWPPTGLEPRGCPLPGACSCPSDPLVKE